MLTFLPLLPLLFFPWRTIISGPKLLDNPRTTDRFDERQRVKFTKIIKHQLPLFPRCRVKYRLFFLVFLQQNKSGFGKFRAFLRLSCVRIFSPLQQKKGRIGGRNLEGGGGEKDPSIRLLPPSSFLPGRIPVFLFFLSLLLSRLTDCQKKSRIYVGKEGCVFSGCNFKLRWK